MNYKYHMVLFAAIVTTGFTATAQKIYENVDKQGEVEFSDQSSPGAKAIEVNPNVIDVTPVKAIESSSPMPTGEAPATRGGLEPEVFHQGVADDYDGDRSRRRETRRDGEARMEHKEGAVHAPAHEGAVHRGGRHR